MSFRYLKVGQKKVLIISAQYHSQMYQAKFSNHGILFSIITHLCENHVLFVNKHGFWPTLSCEIQLFKFVSDIHQNLHWLDETHAKFVDFSNAFDQVPHNRLLKLRSIGVELDILGWTETFLMTRMQYVVYDTNSSSSTEVRSASAATRVSRTWGGGPPRHPPERCTQGGPPPHVTPLWSVVPQGPCGVHSCSLFM